MIAPENLLIFDIDGEVLPFDKTTVPNPPPINFSDDLPRLFLNGRGIGVKHWAQFYKKRAHIKQHAWDVLRVKWGTWKFIVEERERFPSEAAFWARYSNEKGARLNYQKIIDSLQNERSHNDERDSAAALAFFAGDLSRPEARGYFIYKKSGRSFICNKPAAIAQKWRQLLGDHPDIAQQYKFTTTVLNALAEGTSSSAGSGVHP
ncbi:hypothetical protein C2E23DRAFT_880083 [Lenzites betulinus]|nr:hypothetical protein C2E23DRAFT_880083 [Lenzites betulinus]